MATSPQIIFRFNAIKISDSLQITEIYMESQKILNSQCNPYQKKSSNGSIVCPDFKLHYKATVIKTVWFWYKNIHRDQRNRNESQELDPHLYEKGIYNDIAKSAH